MRVITENTDQTVSESSVVAIGNFDGIHRGHQALLERVRQLAASGQEKAVLCFEPLPQAWFRPQAAPGRLTSPAHKTQLLEQAGMDLVWMMRFNQELAEMSPEQFAERVLSRSLSVRHVVVGEDFRFGHQRQGDLPMLAGLGKKLGFAVDVVPDVNFEGLRVSSSAVREALAVGDLARAESLLGRKFSMQGEVIRGLGLGQKLGYPTANMKLEASPSPVEGVFAVRARVQETDQWMDGVASLGRRPAVGGKEFLIEVHIFDFSADLYGKRLEVELIAKIRDEENFGTMDELVEQMKIDEARSRKILRGSSQSK